MTTSNFILKTRLNRARKQLSVTQKQIDEVAMDCGFNDFAYFSRSFKKEFGMTPSSFQRLNNSLN
jgi:two-component system sensor histidine kinase ChiS